jgi:hypothetical protein
VLGHAGKTYEFDDPEGMAAFLAHYSAIGVDHFYLYNSMRPSDRTEAFAAGISAAATAAAAAVRISPPWLDSMMSLASASNISLEALPSARQQSSRARVGSKDRPEDHVDSDTDLTCAVFPTTFTEMCARQALADGYSTAITVW